MSLEFYLKKFQDLNTLRQHGHSKPHKVCMLLAVMDLIRTDQEGNQSAILTDDQRFFSAPTAKAALAYHPILLESKGWGWEWKWSRRF